MKTILLLLSTVVLQPLFAQNVLITDEFSPNEPSIMMDPNNTDNLVAGAILDNYAYSHDGGLTWTAGKLYSSFGVWGDPVIDVDVNGDFYYFHLSNPPSGSWIDRIVCQKSTDLGVTWNDGTFTGLNGTKAQDKHWTSIDRSNNNIYMTWTQFDDYGSSSPTDSSIILFSKSTDAGGTWSTPMRINKQAGDCVDTDNTVEGAVPAVGPNGEIYVSWAGPGGIHFDKSTDQGNTWLNNDVFVNPMPTGWDYAIPGLSRCNGLPVTKCDTSGGANHGTIYINWSDQRNGPDDTDIWVAKSTDGGTTWGAATRVNNDNSQRHQFMCWMDIDQTTGHLYVVFYDRRDYNNDMTDVYLGISQDGGNTFINRKISETPFVPNSGVFFGDYTNITVHNGIVRPIWTRYDTDVSIWTDVTPLSDILSNKHLKEDIPLEVNQYPNPSQDISYVAFKLHESKQVSLNIRDAHGKIIHQILSDATYDYGRHIISIPIEELGISRGLYYTELIVGGTVKTQKMVVVD